jgi:hypothetical protein
MQVFTASRRLAAPTLLAYNHCAFAPKHVSHNPVQLACKNLGCTMVVGAVCMPVCMRKAQAQAIHVAKSTCWYPANSSSAAIMSLPSSTTVLCFTPSR